MAFEKGDPVPPGLPPSCPALPCKKWFCELGARCTGSQPAIPCGLPCSKALPVSTKSLQSAFPLRDETKLPIRYKILPDLQIVLVHFLGEVGPEEHIASFMDYAAEPQFDPRHHILLDLSHCQMNDSYFEDMQRLAYRLNGYYKVRALTSKTAVFAPGDVVYGMSRMYQSISEGVSPWEMGVFRTRAEAMAFVGIAADTDEEGLFMTAWST